ncbi:aminotransferase class V-fold PLP-dependent enzyme [Flavobacteriales bacterium]|nr:aminotransferase class V-fold PLP-dependent enzyme [Flavobacteriales bacterium]
MKNLRGQFNLRPDITHLNHGSFGACPKPIFEDYQKWQLELEKNPVQFFVKEGIDKLDKSREALGKFVGCNADNLVFTMNPSYALNIVAKGFKLKEGDEILATDLEYGAMDRTWNYYCRKVGAKYVQQKFTLPVTSKDQIISEFFKGLTPKTRAIFISHITSTTALRLPVEEICDIAKEKGLITIVDGAHVPGHIPLNLQSLKADIYTGACHKWMLTPKGCSFLYVKKEYQPFDPLLISWGFETDMPSDSQFIDHHQLQGTRDYSAFLTIPKAIEFRAENDWKTVSTNCKSLVRANAIHFSKAAGGELLCPISDDFLGQMCSVRINCSDPISLHDKLYADYNIEIPVMQHGDSVFMRFSINGYNSQEEIDKLCLALEEVKSKSNLLG